MQTRQVLLSRTGVLLLSALFLLPLPAGRAEDLNEYRFVDQDGNAVDFPTDIPLYWKEKPGPWRGLEAAHDVTIKTRMRKEGLEMSRVINIKLSHKDTEGEIKSVYVLDKDHFVVGYQKFAPKAGPDLEANIEITSVINYVEICILCSKHGMWKKIYRFV
jgi:hypothetical protein